MASSTTFRLPAPRRRSPRSWAVEICEEAEVRSQFMAESVQAGCCLRGSRSFRPQPQIPGKQLHLASPRQLLDGTPAPCEHSFVVLIIVSSCEQMIN
jgi:hypothetical protein